MKFNREILFLAEVRFDTTHLEWFLETSIEGPGTPVVLTKTGSTLWGPPFVKRRTGTEDPSTRRPDEKRHRTREVKMSTLAYVWLVK